MVDCFFIFLVFFKIAELLVFEGVDVLDQVPEESLEQILQNVLAVNFVLEQHVHLEGRVEPDFVAPHLKRFDLLNFYQGRQF